MKTYKIYCLKNPETSVIRYIGVTTAKYLSARLNHHYYMAMTKNSKMHVSNWIRKIGQRPIIELIEICTKNNWQEREKYWIAHYPNLTNIKSGGNGVFIDRTCDSIQRSAKAHEIKVCQLNEQGELIKVWDSSVIAANALGMKSNSSICNVLQGISNRAFGFRWCKLKDYNAGTCILKQNKPPTSKTRTVYLYDINYNFIKKFKSINLLKEFLNEKYHSAICSAINRNVPLRKKYFIKDYKI